MKFAPILSVDRLMIFSVNLAERLHRLKLAADFIWLVKSPVGLLQELNICPKHES